MPDHFRVNLSCVSYTLDIGTSPYAQQAIKYNNMYQESGDYNNLRESFNYLQWTVLNDRDIGNQKAVCFACISLANSLFQNLTFNHYQYFFIAGSVTNIIKTTNAENDSFKKPYLQWVKIRDLLGEEIQKTGIDREAAKAAGVTLPSKHEEERSTLSYDGVTVFYANCLG